MSGRGYGAVVRRLLPALSLAAALLASSLAPVHAATLPSRATWLRDTETSMVGAESYLRDRVAQRAPGQRMAVVLDIDNTALQTKYAYPQATPAVLRYAKLARSLGVAVFFDTGRYQSTLQPVLKVVRGAGYDTAGICGRQPREALAHSKVRCRRIIIAQGYQPLSMVGNRATDFQGGYYERGWKLPDYGGLLA